MSLDLILKTIKPESELEMKIVSNHEFIEGVMWGKPRNGHPEGMVITHIGHVLNNIDFLKIPDYRSRLRLIAILHDSFKYKVDKTKNKCGENHHGMIARRFAEKYIDDTQILEIIELHDEAFNAWRKGKFKNKWATQQYL